MNRNYTPAQKIAKETTISFVGMGYGQALRYLFTAILAQFVGLQYLGIYSLGNAVTRLTEVIGLTGMDSGIMRFVSRQNMEKDRQTIQSDIQSVLKMGLIFSLIIMTAQILLAGWLVENIFHESALLKTVLIVNAISLPFSVLMIIAVSATQGFQLLKYKTIVQHILNPTILTISMIVLYIAWSSEMAIILPALITAVVGFIIANYFLKKIAGVGIVDIKKSTFNRKIFTYSVPIMFTVILVSLLHWMDIFMLGYFTNAETVGLYLPAVRTAGLPQSILASFGGIFAPMFSGYFAKNDQSGMKHIYQLTTRWILSFSAPILILILLFPNKLMLLFGAEFMQSSQALTILVVGTSIFAFLGISGGTLVVTGHQKLNLINTLIALLLNIILNVILIPKYGIIGAAWATFIAMTVVILIRTIEVGILLKLSPVNTKSIKPFAAGLVTYVIVLFLKTKLMPFHTIITLILAIILIVGIFAIILWLLRFDEEDLDFLRSLKLLKNKAIEPIKRK